MDIKAYQKSDLHGLFQYWRKVGANAPYFFPVSASHWQTCLLEDTLDGEKKFKSLETYLATERGQVVGFMQWGDPHFAWDESGKHYNPPISVVRQLYFEKGRDDVGQALWAQAKKHADNFDPQHAFYHILGMSCNAHHGKLHHSQAHIDQFLLHTCGFRVEHENVYYVLDMKGFAPVKEPQLYFRSIDNASGERFEIGSGAEVLGTAQVSYLDRLTGGHTCDTAYLTWIGVAEQHRRQGIGAELLTHLVQFLLRKQYRYLHTDTASVNVRAQRFYEKLGFRNAGYTRSYIQT